MMINITGKNLTVTPAIRQHIEDKFKKLEKWRSQLINPHIVLSKIPEGYKAEADISIPQSTLIASAKHVNDMYVAVNELFHKLELQLNKMQHKDIARRANDSIKNMEILSDQT